MFRHYLVTSGLKEKPNFALNVLPLIRLYVIMIKSAICAAVASVPLTVVADYMQYLITDWEFAKWIAVLIVIDTLLGIAKHLLYKDASSEDFWSGFAKKISVYLVLMILSNVLSNYTIYGEAVGSTEWMSKYLCIYMIVREAISIVENSNAIYPILPAKLIKRFKDFGENGEYLVNDKEK